MFCALKQNLCFVLRFKKCRKLCLYRIGSRVVSNKYIGSAGGHFEPQELNDPRACVLRELQEELGLADEDMKNIAGFLRSIEGVKMAATVRQDTEGHTGLSVRAVPGWDAAAVCEKFGGGGHKGAAGASLGDVTLTEAMEALKEAIQK